jgi:hypothetical protein
MVAINAKWVGRGPGEEGAGVEGEAEGCPRKTYQVALYQETFGYDAPAPRHSEFAEGELA